MYVCVHICTHIHIILATDLKICYASPQKLPGDAIWNPVPFFFPRTTNSELNEILDIVETCWRSCCIRMSIETVRKTQGRYPLITWNVFVRCRVLEFRVWGLESRVWGLEYPMVPIKGYMYPRNIHTQTKYNHYRTNINFEHTLICMYTYLQLMYSTSCVLCRCKRRKT